MKEAAMAIQYQQVTLSHGKTRYIEAGQGDPVILIHGAPFQRSADDWRPNLDALASRFRVLAPDCVGWSPSDLFDQEYSFAYLTDFVREFQDALGIKRSHVIGASMGGWIAALLCYESPDRVEKCIQTGHNGVGARPNLGMVNWKPPTDDAIRDWVRKVAKGTETDVEAMAEERVRKAHEPGRFEAFGKIMRHMGDGPTRERYDVLRRLPHITTPTLFVWGKQDPSFPLADKARDATPGSKLVVLDCGHDVNIEAPQEFNQAALEFLG
jgi:2-hydroxy-6-oxonona-2,4-dienedioate hydrolase